jgi:uncharacterized protein (DUF58 family)
MPDDVVLPEKRPPLPITRDELRRFLFKARQEMPSAGLGPTRRRRLGQSLEYRDHREYLPGDDFRNIDWRASLRYKRASDWLVRSFEAEEQYSMVVAVDVRPEMWAPEIAPPMVLALWLADALGELAISAKLGATILPLFANAGPLQRPARGRTVSERFSAFLDQTWANRPTASQHWMAARPTDASDLLRHLPPSAVVVVITDGTFVDDKPDFADIVRRAQGSRRHVSLVILDSWPAERRLLEGLSVRLMPIGGFAGREELADPSRLELDEAEERLAAARQRFQVQAGGLVVDQWKLRADAMDIDGLRGLFIERFERFVQSSQIFARGRS